LSDTYKIFETLEFSKSLSRLQKRDQIIISKKLSLLIYPQLKENPYAGVNIKKLRNYTPDTWRYRTGRFRIFYTINDVEKIIAILTIDDRKDAYK